MFTSAILKIEPGLISHLSIGVIMVFGYILNRWKRLVLVGITSFSILVLFMGQAFAAFAVAGGCGTLCLSNQQQYGSYYGGAQCGVNTPSFNQGIYPFQNYQNPWSSPSLYTQNPLYAGYGSCLNCQGSFSNPGLFNNQGNSGSFIIR